MRDEIGIRYCGTWEDPSGYGMANRNFITALVFGGINVSTELVAQTPEKSQYGWIGELATALQDRNIDYKIKIIHLTPDLYPNYKEIGKYHIGHLFWETSKLPLPWVKPCNTMDEIWCASEQQADMLVKSGITVPIYWFPQPIDTNILGRVTIPYIIPDFNGFLFYAIFQWIERKNPKKLLQTYWKTFSGKTDVGLLLKTYRIIYQETEIQKIKEDILNWKKELNLSSYPPIFLQTQLLDTDEIFRLHLTGDCFINASRGEGWNIPSSEAMLMENPMISIDKTGITDYLPPDLYYPCKTTETQVTEQSFIPWYTKDQKWLEINEEDLSKHMLYAYNNRKESKEVGQKAQEFIKENFNYYTVGNAMRERLEQIYETL